jgi:hypothetical protein
MSSLLAQIDNSIGHGKNDQSIDDPDSAKLMNQSDQQNWNRSK